MRSSKPTKPRVRDQEADPRYTTASIDPLTLRYLAMVVADRGYDAGRLCHGLGFAIDDLQKPDFRISYRQGSLMIRRAYRLVGDPALGLIVGERETPVSWGLVGFGMMSCATLAEATIFGLRFQQEAGSLADITLEEGKGHMAIVASPLFFDPDIELFLIEEMFSSMVRVVRFLVGDAYAPTVVEVVYPRPPHAERYAAMLRCPVRFGCAKNRIVTSAAWMDAALPTHDALVARSVRDLIERNLLSRRAGVDLAETVERAVLDNLHDPVPLGTIAASLNLSERTLRRRLTEAGFGYTALVESVRKARALELLTRSSYPIAKVAAATGFNDVRNFRRAFKRWTGVTPTQIRISEASGP